MTKQWKTGDDCVHCVDNDVWFSPIKAEPSVDIYGDPDVEVFGILRCKSCGYFSYETIDGYQVPDENLKDVQKLIG
jgi:hypothetical protein